MKLKEINEAKRIIRLEDALEFCKKQSMLEQVVANKEWKHYSLATKALEKQIPKKPMGIYDENEHHIKDDDDLYEPALFGVCPVCNQEVQDGMIYCSFCGQALDWSDTE